LTNTSTSTSTPLAISSSTISGSCRPSAARLLRRGFRMLVAATGSPNSHCTRSISCTAESAIIPSVVKPYGGADRLRCAQCISSGVPIVSWSRAAFSAR